MMNSVSNMNDSHTFFASRRKAVLLLLGSILFVAGGIWMSNEKPVLGWLCAGFFALGIPASFLMMWPNAMYLRLNQEGFEMRSMFGRHMVLWSEVDGFRISSIRGAKMIEIIFNEAYTRQKLGRAVAASVSGMEGAIPNSYNASLDEVLRMLNRWKARFDENGPDLAINRDGENRAVL
jgi:hypothetical protein